MEISILPWREPLTQSSIRWWGWSLVQSPPTGGQEEWPWVTVNGAFNKDVITAAAQVFCQKNGKLLITRILSLFKRPVTKIPECTPFRATVSCIALSIKAQMHFSSKAQNAFVWNGFWKFVQTLHTSLSFFLTEHFVKLPLDDLSGTYSFISAIFLLMILHLNLFVVPNILPNHVITSFAHLIYFGRQKSRHWQNAPRFTATRSVTLPWEKEGKVGVVSLKINTLVTFLLRISVW